jgi:hypothetical protein
MESMMNLAPELGLAEERYARFPVASSSEVAGSGLTRDRRGPEQYRAPQGVRAGLPWMSRLFSKGAPRGQFIGTIGKRDLFTLTLVAIRQGWLAGSTVYEFRDASGSAVAWFSCDGVLEIGQTYQIIATVHRHLRYQDVPTTYVTRVTVLLSSNRAPFAAAPVCRNARATYQRIAAGTTHNALRNRLRLTATSLPMPPRSSFAT